MEHLHERRIVHRAELNHSYDCSNHGERSRAMPFSTRWHQAGKCTAGWKRLCQGSTGRRSRYSSKFPLDLEATPQMDWTWTHWNTEQSYSTHMGTCVVDGCPVFITLNLRKADVQLDLLFWAQNSQRTCWNPISPMSAPRKLIDAFPAHPCSLQQTRGTVSTHESRRSLANREHMHSCVPWNIHAY